MNIMRNFGKFPFILLGGLIISDLFLCTNSNFHGANSSDLLDCAWNSYRICFNQPYIRKKFLKHRVIYTRNGTSSFNPELLVLKRSGDIHPNPGPNTTQTVHVMKSKNNHDYNIGNKTHPNLCSDLPSGFRLTEWNLRSLAPRTNNTKLD